MDSLIDKLTQEIEKLSRDSNYHLIEIKLSKSKRFTGIQIILDRDDGYLSHQDCKKWSSELLDVIDGKNLVRGNYRLEISSPGIGRPLRKRWEFEKNLEKSLKISYRPDDELIKEISGILICVSDEGITLRIKNDSVLINWEKLINTVVKTPW